MQDQTEIKTPYFLVGAVRSGTTLLRLMLDSHPKIAFAPEFEFAVRQMTDEGAFPNNDNYHKFLSEDADFKRCHYSVNKLLNYKELMNDFLLQKLAEGKKQVVGATIHELFNRVPYIWQNAKYIHIIRDPRDVARSAIGMGWCGNVWVGASYWFETEKLWETFKGSLREDQFIELKYEDLVGDNKKVLTDICEFMNCSYDDRMMGYASTSTYELPDPSRVYPWRKKLNVLGVQQVESKCADLLEKRGYALSDHPKRTFSSQEINSFLKDSENKKRKFRIKRYGFWLLLFTKISKVLKLGYLQEFFQSKIDRISSQYIK